MWKARRLDCCPGGRCRWIASVGGRWELSLYAAAAEAGGVWRVPAVEGLSAGGSDPTRGPVGGGAAGAGEDPPLLRREPAEPARDADLRGRGLPRPGAAARGRGGVLQGAAAGARAARHSRICGCRSGIRAATGCTCISRSAATCEQSLIREAWGQGSCTSSCSVICRSARASLAEARLAARYLCEVRRQGARRRAPPRRVCTATRSRRASSREAVLVLRADRSSEAIGAGVGATWAGDRRRWRSSSVEGWHGPPACWVAWAWLTIPALLPRGSRLRALLQGLPVRLRSAILAQVLACWARRPALPGGAPQAAPGSGPPDGGEAAGVEAVVAAPGRGRRRRGRGRRRRSRAAGSAAGRPALP